MSVLLTLVIGLAFILAVYLITLILGVGVALDYLGELGSGPRFLYMSIPWLVSSDYREYLRQEHCQRNKFVAWLEYLLAAFFLALWLALIFWGANKLAIDIVGPS